MTDIKTSLLTHIAKREDISTTKAHWYDVIFANEDMGVMAANPQNIPPVVGDTLHYRTKATKSKAGEDVTLIEWVLPPSMRPEPEPTVTASEARRPDRETLIVRQSCMKAAVDFVCHLPMDQRHHEQIVQTMRLLEAEVLRSV
jgi:hypothetical protein